MSVTALCSIEVGVLHERKLPSGGVAHSVRKTTIRAGSEFDPGEYGIEADELASLKAAGRVGSSKADQARTMAKEAETEANRPKPEGNDGKKAKS